MMKRIIALLLALILTVGLLPTVALAADETGGETPTTDENQHPTEVKYEDENSPIHITKRVTEEDGKNYLTMEAYVTSPVEIKQKAVPLDIVLVLDVSGSMDDPFGQTDTYEKYTENYYQSLTNDFYAEQNNLYYEVNGTYYPVTIDVAPNYTKLSNTPTYINAYYSDYYVKKTSETEYKSLRFEWGYDNNWNYGYYMYVGEERIALVSDWYSEIDLPDYEFFTQDYSNATYTYKYATAENAYTTIGTSTGANTKPGYGFYRKGTGSVSKMKALQDAANNFIDSVLANSTDLPANTAHRISIVKFAGKESTRVGNDTYKDGRYTYNYSQTVAGLTSVDATSVSGLKTKVTSLHAAGATAADYGMKRAKAVLDAREGADANRPAVVVMFTDGEPNHENGFDRKVARDTIKVASELKKNNTTVYTIAVTQGADPDKALASDLDMNKYMHAVSSNYPDATVDRNQLTMGNRVASTKNYYYKATDAEGLKTVFQTISNEISNLPLVVDEETVLYDTLTEHFNFDGVSSADTSKVEVKVVPVKTGTLTGALEWDTANARNLENPIVTVSQKSIEVKNFDYAENAVKILTNMDGTKTVQSGAKLVIKFPIKVDTTCTNWDKNTEYYDTNTANAGLKKYATVKEPDKRTQSTELPDSPELPVGVYTVSYAYTTDSEYTGTALPDGGTYVNSQEHNVVSGLADVSGYRFDGWYTDGACTTSAGNKVVINGQNVTLYGKYTKNTTKVNLTQYIEKKLTATSLPSGYSESFKAEITGSPLTTAAEITTDNFDAAGTKNFNETVEVELTYGQDYTFKVKEVKPTTGATEGMTYDETEYTLTVKVSNTGVVTTESSNGAGATKVTITNEYKPGSIDFSLTGKFQKTLNSNTANLPAGANSFTLTIKNGDTTLASGTAMVDLTGSNETYTGNADFFGTNDKLIFNQADIYIYTVQETVGSVKGMSYDTTSYTLTIKVEDKSGALEVTKAEITGGAYTSEKPLNLLADGGKLTITNTFTAATLPLDPPLEEPEESDPTAGFKVIKSLTGDTRKNNMTFTAEMTGPGITGRKTATATVEANANNASFNGFGTLVFTKAGTYTYEIKEEAGNDAGVSYDGHTYTLTVVVTADGDELKITSATYTDNDTVAAGTALPVTITNRYTKPAYKIEKNVITDTSVKIPAWSLDYPDPGEIKVVVDADQQEIVLGYVIKITGSAGASFTLTEDEGSQFVTVHNADGEFTPVTPGKKLSFTLTQDYGNEHPILIYTTKVISRDPETGAFPAKVKNVVTEEDDTTHESGETTIEERGTLTVDFGALVRKHLTVTGDKSFNGATFTVNFTEGMFIKNGKENEPEISSVEVYAADAGVNERGLPNLTASVTYGADERNAGYKPFDGADLTIRVEGTYFYLVSEVIPDGATGYDTNEYIIGISVENDGDHLKVAGVGYSKYIENSQEDPEITWNEGPTFYNTIDTGKDDYYPIIIPTIINKDTGMLNKTDHFAYVIGYPDGTVHPNGQITRAEVATIFFRLLRDEVRDGAFTTSNSYSDVAYGKWYNNPISTMSALGIITGYPDGTFKPNKPITRAEFAAIAARFDETQSGKSATFSDVIGHWAAKEIGIAYYNDWIKGYPDGTFKPDQNITRAEAMTLINRVLERKPESPADLLTNMNKWTDNMDTSKWYYLDVQEATNSHGYTRKTFNYELWRQMLPDPDWSRYER